MKIALTLFALSSVFTCSVLSDIPRVPSAVVYFQPPKNSARNHNANTQDWDVIYKFINKIGSFSKSSVKRSQQDSGSSPISAFGSLLYGLSMAAGLALGVSISESPLLNAFINGMDYRFLTRRSQIEPTHQPPVIRSGVKLHDPLVHRFVAPAKDGKNHYHHVVHYHIPYPLSVGALESARQNYPQISWYGSGLVPANSNVMPNGAEKTTSILSGYLGPMHKSPDLSHDQVTNDLRAVLGEDMRRNDRHDFKVFSEADYFKNLQRSRSKFVNPKPVRTKANLEEMLLTADNRPQLLTAKPLQPIDGPEQQTQNVTLGPEKE